MVCVNRVCQIPEGCESDDECPPLFSCVGGSCVFTPPPECSVDADCSSGEICEFGFCIPGPECRTDAECPPGFSCRSGQCLYIPECSTDDECGPGEICDLYQADANADGTGDACAVPEPGAVISLVAGWLFLSMANRRRARRIA